MAKRGPEEITKEVEENEAHPYAFHVSGPRNLNSPNWRDLINSSWSVPISPFSLNFYINVSNSGFDQFLNVYGHLGL